MGTPCFREGDCGLDCAAEASKRLCSLARWALCGEGRFLAGRGSAWRYQAHGFPRLCREVPDAATPDSPPHHGGVSLPTGLSLLGTGGEQLLFW